MRGLGVAVSSHSLVGCVPSAHFPAWHDWHQQQRATPLSRHAARDRSEMWEFAYAGPGNVI